MKNVISLLFSVFLLISTTQSFAQQQELSDYEIQKNFKTEFAKYKNQIDTVAVADSAEAILQRVQALDSTYQDHEELLNKSLYPDTYEQQIQELRQAAMMASNRLQKMQQQDEQLTNLHLRLLAYQEHVIELTKDADSLRLAMQESIESEKQLSGMVRNYRQNLEERDELILAFIDSTVVAYQQMDLEALQDLENLDGRNRINSDGDALKMIQDISAENLGILKENSSKLRLADYMRMHTVQQRFEQMWSRMGTKITEVYGGNDAEEIAQNIDQNLAEWDKLLEDKTYTTLQDSLQAKGLEISSFQNSEGFYNSLNSYLDQKIEKSRSDASQADYERFQAFQDFWSTVERQWSSHFQEANIMSSPQMATISEKTDTWAQNAKPESNMMLYLLIGAVLLVLIFGGLFIREKQSTKSS
ncbi:hypothetical protein [Fodinibius salsisoli]|uniref:Uncharacterized protein n=1 Tax=Fodinibius salsisoli TaxID=2820877 RepID=A0ABT3PJX2_9BACT|nr:hypothetical protein [Fodinibius salsisoli]MCW9706197.1 hypothetical protein [Fodinibius salsisoli]